MARASFKKIKVLQALMFLHSTENSKLYLDKVSLKVEIGAVTI